MGKKSGFMKNILEKVLKSFHIPEVVFLLPNFITLSALLMSLSSVWYAHNKEAGMTCSLIILAAMADGFDGIIARRLNATSKFGKEFDSLADCIGFGICPIICIYQLLLSNCGFIVWFICSIYAACIAIRLARFNASIINEHYFIGLPSTVSGPLILLPIALSKIHIALKKEIVVVFVLYISFLSISTIKFKSMRKIIVADAKTLPSFLLVILSLVVLWNQQGLWVTFAALDIFCLLYVTAVFLYF